MRSVEEKLFHLLEEIAEENQRLLEMLQAGWTLAEAESKLNVAGTGRSDWQSAPPIKRTREPIRLAGDSQTSKVSFPGPLDRRSDPGHNDLSTCSESGRTFWPWLGGWQAW